jgi:hypothetical protein
MGRTRGGTGKESLGTTEDCLGAGPYWVQRWDAGTQAAAGGSLGTPSPNSASFLRKALPSSPTLPSPLLSTSYFLLRYTVAKPALLHPSTPRQGRAMGIAVQTWVKVRKP